MVENNRNETTIQIKKRESVLRFPIAEENGELTGEYLEFDIEDIEVPIRYQQMLEEHKKNLAYIKNAFIIIDKKQDHKGKKLLSRNEEEKVKTLNEFYKKEMATLDLFLGPDGTKKILHGRKPYFFMFEDIGKMIETILPEIKQGYEDMKKKIKDKYTEAATGDDEILE